MERRRRIHIKKVLSLLAVLFVLTLTGCNNVITEGEVYDKEHRDACTTIIPMTIVHSNGKSSYTTIVPMTYYYPERYVIFIKAYDGDNKEWLTEDYYVDESVYDDINIGDYFVFDEETMLQDEPREKVKE